MGSNRIRFILYSLGIALMLSVSFATLAEADSDSIPLLQQALRFRVTIYTNPRTGMMTAAYHCRRASEGCDRRMGEFAQYLTESGERHGIDPWLLAAMAFRESGLNPFAVGAVGELGILQLHPKSPMAKSVRFVRDQWYRQRCKREPGACQREVVERAAVMLEYSLEVCGGDLNKALGAYNTGHCGGSSRYVARVLGERERLKNAVGLPIEQDAPVPVTEQMAAATVTESSATVHTSSGQ
jgi:hypothetical protein